MVADDGRVFVRMGLMMEDDVLWPNRPCDTLCSCPVQGGATI
jgi:hypothetical protein